MISSTLEHLDLSYNKIGNKGIMNFGKCLEENTCDIKILALNTCHFDNIGMFFLGKSIRTNGSLNQLSVDNNDLNGKYRDKLRDMIVQNNSLRKISFNRWNLGNIGASAVAKGYAKSSNITHINLSNNYISDEGIRPFIKTLKIYRQNYLKMLNLSHNLISQAMAVKLTNIVDRKDQPPLYINLTDNLTKTKGKLQFSFWSL